MLAEVGELGPQLGVDVGEDRLGPFGQLLDLRERPERRPAERVDRGIARLAALLATPPERYLAVV